VRFVACSHASAPFIKQDGVKYEGIDWCEEGDLKIHKRISPKIQKSLK
jgi:hypothetical protein